MKINSRTYRALLCLFFFSGATALIYQVVWTRLLTLAFGSTILAVSTVLTAFMCGLAIGSAWLGSKADRTRHPVRFYAWLELFIGIFAMATPLIFSGIEKLYIYIHGSSTFGFWEASMLRFGLSMLLLLPPTILMGGTLPILSKVFLNQNNEKTGRALSVLYFINTAGAVFGTLAAGLFLLQLLGIRMLLVASGAVNILIFFYAHKIQNQITYSPSQGGATTLSEKDAAAFSGWSRNALLAATALFISGLAALIYEVVWTRVLTLTIGSSTYAFTIMLATFLAGIAMGSAFIGRFSDNRTFRIGLLAFCQVLIGVFALLTATMFGLLPDAFVFLFGVFGEDFNLFMTANFLLCFAVMVPATLFMGASFPVACSIVVESFGTSGKRIGLLYAGNTVGAILGAFLAGFILLPGIGIQHTLLITIILNLTIGLFLSVFPLLEKRTAKNLISPAIALSLIIILSLVWQPEWDKQKMTSGPYAYAAQYQNISIDKRLSTIEQLYYKEGPIATVSVIKEGKHIRLSVDGKTDAGNFRDMTTQVLIGHVPLLVKPDAKDVLVIGFASGITAGAVTQHDIRKVDCVEIEPAMIEASAFFLEENYDIMNNRLFDLVIDDGRSFVLTTKNRYDLVISEPSNPWQSGSSRLFTKEAFLNARNILKDNGVMVQWMHLYGTSVESLRLVARTFMSVFPHTTMWMDPVYADVIFIGSDNELKIDPLEINRIYRERPKVKDSISRIGYTEDWSLIKAFVLGEEELKKFAGKGEFNTDNLPLLEYRAPRSLYSRTALNDNLQAFLERKLPESFPPVSSTPGPPVNTASILSQWGVALARENFLSNARGALLAASRLNPSDSSHHVQLGYLRMTANDISGAIQAYEAALIADPRTGSAHANLGLLYYQTGEFDKAYNHLTDAVRFGEDSSSIRNNIAVILAKKGKIEMAVEEVQKALRLNPDDQTAQNNLRSFQKALGSKRK